MKHNWEYKRLEEISNINMGQSPDSSSYNENGEGLPFFQGCADFGEKYPDTKKYCRLPLKTAEAEEILFSVMAPIGTMNYAKEKSCIGRGLCSIKTLSAVLQNYLYYVLDFSKHKIIEQGRGSTFKSVGKETIANHIIPVPQLKVQEQIVAELDKINEIINDCKEAIRNLDTLTQSLFYDFFGDPLTNPKHWEVCKLGDKFETGSGGTPSKTVNEYWENGNIPWIGSNMCQNKIITETDGKFITSLGLENSSAKVLEPNTVLVALVGATIGKVGLLKIHSSTNQNIGFIKPNPTIAFPLYLFFVIKNLHSLFTNIGNGKFKMANLSFIRNLPIMLPPLSLQNKFASRIEQIEQQKKDLEETIANMQMLLNSRMDYWFN